jgi:hypothetical protein
MIMVTGSRAVKELSRDTARVGVRYAQQGVRPRYRLHVPSAEQLFQGLQQ